MLSVELVEILFSLRKSVDFVLESTWILKKFSMQSTTVKFTA